MVILDTVLKSIILAGVTNLLIDNVTIAICAGIAYYYYESSKNDQT
jgi:hypothetical protein